MKEIKINIKKEQYSNIYFAGKLVAVAGSPKYRNTEIILKTVSENNVVQAVDAKTFLATTALLTVNAKNVDELVFEIRGEEEVFDAMEFKKDVLNIIKESQN